MAYHKGKHMIGNCPTCPEATPLDDLLEAARAFRNAANRLSKVWSDHDSSTLMNGLGSPEVLVDDYPFEHSFDEVALSISDWLHEANLEELGH